MYRACDLEYREVSAPEIGFPTTKPTVPASVFAKRLEKLTAEMAKRELDAVAIYADREHYGNFKFITGFDPRFEEALLIVHRSGEAYCMMGNECLNLADGAKIPVKGVLCQAFSLPGQPIERFVSVEACVAECGIRPGMKVGTVDWKQIRETYAGCAEKITALPLFVYNALAENVGPTGSLVNVTAMMSKACDGLRCSIEAEAAAEFEFGAAVASQSVINMLKAIQPGMKEWEIAGHAQSFGQVLSCHTYCVVGERTKAGLVSPSDHAVELGDPVTLSMGLEGGLTCRQTVLAHGAEDMKADGVHYLEDVVKPYIATVFNWYETIGLDVCCGDIYAMVENQIPKARHGWKLNPGHTCNYEEWMGSPIYENSTEKIRSGIIFQMDIIPSDPECQAPNAEDGVLIADEALRREIQEKYPDVYARMMERRKFAEEQIGLTLKPEVLPLANSFANYNPFAMNRNMALAVRK